METFKSKKIKGDTFGEMLRIRREEMGYSLRDIAKKIKIKISYLEAMEKEDLSSLPPFVYVQGFIIHYSRFLGLDEKLILKRYKTEYDIHNNLEEPKEMIYQSKIKKFSLLYLSPKILKISAVIIILLAFFIYLGWELSGFSSPPSLTIFSPEESERVDGDLVVFSGRGEAGAQVFINGQEVFVDRDGNFQEQIILNDGLNNIEVKARNKMGRERVLERKILASIPEAERRVSGINNTNMIEADKELNLNLKILNSATWVSVDADGVNVFQGTMLPDTARDFKAQDKISVTSGRASNTYVIFNGKDLGNLGKESEVARNVEFTRDMKFSN